MDQRVEFVRLAHQGGVGVAELCRRFGISRDTGHRLLRRHAAAGAEGLAPRSRRPRSSPRRSDAAIEQQVLALRAQHPAWGGRKLARRLRDLGVAGVPAPSTVTEILRRHGRLDPAEAARHRPFQRFQRAAPNELWQMDFKGHFPLDRGRCHALTVVDDHCRYALGLRACGDETEARVKAELTTLFRHYGLPQAMLADNGAPWGTVRGDYTTLGVWLLRLGVRLYHGRPYHPQTQGKDERFHRSLDIELLQSTRLIDLAHAQAHFDRWRRIYNEERPHEALALATPASRYQPSPVSFPETIPPPEYHESDQVRIVRTDGTIRFKGGYHQVSSAFAGLPVAVRPTATDAVWQVLFSRFPLTEIDLRQNQP
jgi:transposase InsO family protein